MAECQLWRQYTIGTRDEPRVHLLLNNLPGTGYKYHNVSLAAQPLETVPEVARLMRDCERRLGVGSSAHGSGEPVCGSDEGGGDNRSDGFNIGADLLAYRDGTLACASFPRQLFACLWHALQPGGARRYCEHARYEERSSYGRIPRYRPHSVLPYPASGGRRRGRAGRSRGGRLCLRRRQPGRLRACESVVSRWFGGCPSG
ncbi:unnamed protein product [Phaeothamnion confervicola]